MTISSYKPNLFEALFLRVMSRTLEREQAQRQRLIDNVLHELRSSLRRMRAIGETIMRRPDEAPALVVLSDAELALLERLIADPFDAARLEQGGDVLRLESVNLSAWWRASMERFRLGTARDGVELTAHGPNQDIAALIDAQRLIRPSPALWTTP